MPSTKTFFTTAVAALMSVAAADNCYMQIQQQFNIDNSSPIEGEVKRGDCPMDVDTPNTDNCREIGSFIPSSKGPNNVETELPYSVVVHVTGGTNGFNDG